MLKAGNQAKTASDNHTVNQAAQKRKTKHSTEKTAALPAIVAVVGAIAAFAWWRRRNRNSGNNNSSQAGRKSRQRGGAVRESISSGLPRNKASNNKKNKERRRSERERRADKRERQEGRSGPSDPGHEQEQDNTIILTSKFVDTTPKTISNLPKAQRMGQPRGSEGEIDPAMSETWKRKS